MKRIVALVGLLGSLMGQALMLEAQEYTLAVPRESIWLRADENLMLKIEGCNENILPQIVDYIKNKYELLYEMASSISIRVIDSSVKIEIMEYNDMTEKEEFWLKGQANVETSVIAAIFKVIDDINPKFRY